MPGKDMREGVVEGLAPETKYVFRIQAVTVFGDRYFAALTTATTGQDRSEFGLCVCYFVLFFWFILHDRLHGIDFA